MVNFIKFVALGAVILLVIQQIGQRGSQPSKGEPAMDFDAKLIEGHNFA